MQFIKIKDQAEAGEMLAKKIGEYLGHGKKVLWLLSGGSNIILSRDFKYIEECFR